MHLPSVVVRWEVLGQHRWSLATSLLWFLAVLALSRALSSGVIFGIVVDVPRDVITMLLLLGILAPVLELFLRFTYSRGADIATRESIFPPRLLVLPLATRDLVAWPMLYGAAMVSTGWLAFSSFVLRRRELDVPLWWPTALIVSSLAWIQALSWRPFGLAGLRIVTAAIPIGVLVAVSSLCWVVHLPELLVALLLVMAAVPAYGVAVAGVARARRGDQPDWRWLAGMLQRIGDAVALRGQGFGSMCRAQTWFEWRRRGLDFPVLAGLMLPIMASVVVVNHGNEFLAAGSLLRSPLLLLAVPLFAAMAGGGGQGNCGNARQGYAIQAFLATRPMTCAAIVWAKLKAAVIGVAIVWAITLAVVALTVLWTGTWGELKGQWEWLASGLSAVQKVMALVLIALFLPAATWKGLVANVFLGLTGRAWVYGVGAFVMGCVVVGMVPAGCWIFTHPEYQERVKAVLQWAPQLVAAVKIVMGACLVRVLIRRGLMPARMMRTLLAGWLLTVVVLSGLVCWLVPRSLVPWHLAAACVVLFLPAVRLSLAPLALAWNRHR